MSAAPTVTKVNPQNIQGDILAGGLPKKTQTYIFFKITDGKKFVTDLVKLAPMIQTVKQTLANRDAINKHKKEKKKGLIKMVGANISLTYTGLQAMGITDAKLAGTSLDPSSQSGGPFKLGGLADAVKSLGDPLLPGTQTPDWDPAFLGQIDGVILVAGDCHQSVQEKITQIQTVFPADPNHSSITIITSIVGDVRPGDESGHEHFGFLDGVSNPSIAGFDPLVPGPAPIDASHMLTGHNTNNTSDWTVDGSFLVFRYLFQKVPEFNTFLNANALKKDPITSADLSPEDGSDLLGARLVGRWKSGAPVDITPFHDDPVLAQNLNKRNDFSFADEFRDNNKCPWAAHIRRTNPRTDTTRLGPANGDLSPRRIMRRGIAFGPEVTPAEQSSNTTQEGRGLLFACYQADISTAFQFIQRSWANNPAFPFIAALGDIGPGFNPGVDPLIGQPGPPQLRDMVGYDPLTANDPDQARLSMPVFIVPRGGVYLFTPSIDLLQKFGQHIDTTTS